MTSITTFESTDTNLTLGYFYNTYLLTAETTSTTITLPPIVSNGFTLTFKRVDLNYNFTILLKSSDLIDGEPDYLLTPRDAVTITTEDGTWKVISRQGRRVFGFSARCDQMESLSGNDLLSAWTLETDVDVAEGFDETNGTYQIQESGLYQINITANYETVTNGDLAGPNYPTLVLRRSSPTTDNLRTMNFPLYTVSGNNRLLPRGLVTYAGYYQLEENDIIQINYLRGTSAITINLGTSTQPVYWSVYLRRIRPLRF